MIFHLKIRQCTELKGAGRIFEYNITAGGYSLEFCTVTLRFRHETHHMPGQRKMRSTPNTLPMIWQSSTMIGAMVSFSGWRRI